MRKILLAAFLFGFGRLAAQTSIPSQVVACANSYAEFRGFGGSYWQASYDGGHTWTTTIPGSGTVPDAGGIDLALNNVAFFPNKTLFQICNPGTPTTCSIPDTLYINNGLSTAPTILNPPTTVCAGSSLLFTATGGLDGLTNDSVSWEITIDGSTAYFEPPINDSTIVINFPLTATGNATITASNFTGCGFASGTPLTVAIQSPSTSLAGTAGGSAACTNVAVYPGGQPSYNSSSDPALTTTATDGSCDAIASILPSGSSPVAGTVQSCVTVASSTPSYNGIAYVPRYYSMEPSTNASTSTATVTLYFTQADFDAYNTARGSEPALPTVPTDAAGIANLRVSQFHGTGTTPDTYVGGSGTIDPADNNIVWDATNLRWSVTFDITGFSGFFVSGTPIVPLPLTLTNFSGQATVAGNLLSWQTASEENTSYFEVQRTAAGSSTFEDLGRVAAAGNSSLTRQYNYTDAFSGATHPTYTYRLKMVDLDGQYTYSPIVTLGSMAPSLTVTVSPNPFVQPVSVTVGSPVAGTANVVLLDMSGAKLAERSVVLQKGDNALDVSLIAGLSQGVYLLQVTTGTQQQTVRFVKE